MDVCRGAGRSSRVPRSRSQALHVRLAEHSQSLWRSNYLLSVSFSRPPPLAGDSKQPSYTQKCTEARGILIRWVTLTIFTHLDYAHMCAFKFVCAAKVVCPQNSTKNIPRFRKVFTVSSILLKLCDSKCSLICEGTIKSSSLEPTIANYIRVTSSIPIYLMTEKKLK